MNSRLVTFSVLLLTALSGANGVAADGLSVDELPPGLVVCLGCDDAGFLTSLRQQDARVVHVPDALAGENLPYVDNLVNAIVSVGQPSTILRREVLRVLAPGGVAVVLKDASGAVIERFTKPRPDTIDDWTHFLHGADNNAVANDSVVGPPRHMQWLAGPKWTRHHDVDKGGNPSVRGVLTAGGRIYTMIDETPSSDMTQPGTWFLHARDAFNGIPLWKKPVKVERETLDRVWRSMIVDEQHVYAPLGPGEPLSIIDGKTGRTLRSCAGTEGYTEIVKDGAGLYLVIGGAIVCADAVTGERRWAWRVGENESIIRLTLAAADGRVFVRTTRRVCCLTGGTGALAWDWAASPPQKPMAKRRAATHERLLVANGVVLASHAGNDPNVLGKDAPIYKGSHARIHDYGGRLSALSAEKGQVLWTSEYLPNLDDRKPGEVYVIGDMVWQGPDFGAPRDLQTGKVLQTRDVLNQLWTDGHHYRCYPGKATSRYIMTAKRGTEFFDVVGNNHSRNNWLRSTCTVGLTPANGMLYLPPHSCGCYIEAQLFGFWAVAGEEARSDTPAVPDAERLEKGAAYGKLVPRLSDGGNPATWPTYRGNSERGGSSPYALPDKLHPTWTADVGDQLGAVTAADGKVFAVSTGRHTLHALSTTTGKEAWQFRAGGRIDSPPTVVSGAGCVLLGSRDGYVYCLRASDGALVWRFLAATKRLHTVAFGEVESVWPVHGSVLVQGGVAYASAGRSSYLDGGIDLYALDPATGKVLHRRTVASEPVGAMKPPEDADKYAKKISQNWLDYMTFLAPDKSDSFSMAGLRADVMTARKGDVFLRHMAFNAGLEPQEQVRPHLMATFSLLDDTQHNRAYWILGTGNFARTPVAYPWILQKKIAVPYGVMLSFDEKTAWCVRQQGRKRGPVRYDLVAVPRPDSKDPSAVEPDFGQRTALKPLWSVELPIRPRAMVRAGDTVYVAGIAETPVLLTVTRDGIAQRHTLPAPPSWDGMAATKTQLFVPLENGTLVSFGHGRE